MDPDYGHWSRKIYRFLAKQFIKLESTNMNEIPQFKLSDRLCKRNATSGQGSNSGP